MIIDGRKIRDDILEEIKKEVAALPFQPIFCDVLVGGDAVSAQYVRMKAKTAESVGIAFCPANFPETITTESLIEEIKKINSIPNMCGIIVQLPLPAHLDQKKVLDAIDTKLDVDCLGEEASAAFYEGKNEIGYPTALASVAILDSLKSDLSDKKIVVLGHGALVGKPVSVLLKFRGLDHIIITRKTPARNAYGIAVLGGENKEELLKNADVIISGIGQGAYLKGDMIKKGAIIIDAGTSESTGSIVGDVDRASVEQVASYLSPVPGGVGPVTVAMLLANVLKVAKKKKCIQ